MPFPIFLLTVCVVLVPYVASFGSRDSRAGGASGSCSTIQRRMVIGCNCTMPGIPCGQNSICVRSAGSSTGLKCQCGSGFTGTNNGCQENLAVQDQWVYFVGSQTCTNERVFDLACGGTPPLTCSLNFFNATDTASGKSYGGTPPFLNVVNPSTGCCFVTAAAAAPEEDIYVCYGATATDAAGASVSTTSGVCVLFQKPTANANCPAIVPGPLTLASSGPTFIDNCFDPNLPIITLQPSGGTGPFTYSIVVDQSSVIGLSTADQLALFAAPGFSNGLLRLLNPSTGGVTLLPVGPGPSGIQQTITLCYTATVTDAKRATASTRFCATIEGNDCPVVIGSG
ncbi:hypothetical protein RvY_03082 [Ramazzottius varieornatus]|uniref:EGF-like domain-containing protein n=1 Tax=Ramazzottius varieornatus TaxID=947166 RepID=A0A1D1UWC9_RAMVA|nr:hypothetical protein RvY_03082 [Ramazzottius varieornatus]